MTDVQAVVLAAGRGSRMTELTESLPKCLLPVGNKPMIYYPLTALEKADFTDVLIIIPDSHENEIKRALDGKFPKLKLDYMTVPANKEPGTADSLRQAANAHKIKADVLVISCDTITDYPILKFLNTHRTYDPSLTVLLSSLPSPVGENTAVPGRKGKNKLEKDLIAVDEDNERLVFLSSEADFEDNVHLKMTTTERCPKFVVHSNYLDMHVYAMKKWVVDFVKDHAHISSIKGELLPLLLSKQFRKEKKQPENVPSAPSSVIVDTAELAKGIFAYAKGDSHQELFTSDMFQQTFENPAGKTPQKHTFLGLTLEPDEAKVYPRSSISCRFMVQSEGMSIRANTIAAYLEANRTLARSPTSWCLTPTTSASSTALPSTSRTPTRSQIAADSLVAESATIGDKVSVKRTIVGQNCKIADKVKVTGSLLMDGAVVEEGATVAGSIICRGAVIGHSADLKDCIVAAGQTVVALGKLSNEFVIHAGHLMEL